MTYYPKASLLIFIGAFALNGLSQEISANRARAREIGVQVVKKPTGKWNAITDVPGVEVGHTTIHRGKEIHTGVTVVLPHDGNIFQQKVPAAIVVGETNDGYLNDIRDFRTREEQVVATICYLWLQPFMV